MDRPPWIDRVRRRPRTKPDGSPIPARQSSLEVPEVPFLPPYCPRCRSSDKVSPSGPYVGADGITRRDHICQACDTRYRSVELGPEWRVV